MRSSGIYLSVLFFLIFTGINAQVFVGGNTGLERSGGKTDNGTVTNDKPSELSFNISPLAGYFLSDKLAAGAALNLSFTREKSPGTVESITNESTVGINPFLRYYALTWNDFSVFGQGNMGFSFTRETDKVGGTSTDGPKTTRFYVNIMPGLAYNVSDHFSLETSINVVKFGYSHATEKSGSIKNKTSEFGIGAGLDDIIKPGDITIGAIYKF
jgi:outer membrane protein